MITIPEPSPIFVRNVAMHRLKSVRENRSNPQIVENSPILFAVITVISRYHVT